jgi:hypothetical protein
MPERIDYLQIDIEPAYQSLAALRRMPFDKYTFSVITFEHDLYADPKNLKIKQEQQRILLSHGYRLVRENVAVEDQPFEDWWIHD